MSELPADGRTSGSLIKTATPSPGIRSTKPATRTEPGLMMVLTENHTLIPPGDVRGLLDLARIAEDAGFDAVMISEQTMLTDDAAINGLMSNPRMYAAAGNQDPRTAWPSSIATLGAVAAATERVRIVAGALIAPLRHPILLAKDLATVDRLAEGRLVVQPTVSWQRDEYEAYAIPFQRRGAILDEQLAAMAALWAASPGSFEGEFFRFSDVYSEPKPWRQGGPAMWFGGEHVHPALVRRLARYGSGFHPFGVMTKNDLDHLAHGLAAAGRHLTEFEMVGGTRARFDGPDSTADLDQSMHGIGEQLAQGYATFAMKPSQYTDDLAEVPAVCRRMANRLREISEQHAT